MASNNLDTCLDNSSTDVLTNNSEDISDTTSLHNTSIPNPNELLFENDEEQENRQHVDQVDQISLSENMSSKISKIYHKRPGTVDKGREYEKCITTYFVLHILTSQFQESSVWSNDKKFGDFDDVILEVKHNDNTQEKFAIQLKHVSRGKTIRSEKFKGDKGDFSIKKYFESYKKCKKSLEDCKIILWTNSSFYLSTKNRTIDLTKEINLTLEITQCAVPPLLLTSQDTQCFKFNILNSDLDCNSSEFQIHKDFFDQFLLCTSQSHCDELKNTVENLANKMFLYEKSFLNNLSEYINKWFLNENKASKLDKDMISKVIALQLLDSYIHPFSFEPNCKKHSLFQDVISKFDITVFKKDSLEIISRIWGNNKMELLHNYEQKEVRFCLQNFQIAPPDINVEELDDISLSKLLFLMGEYPLIVEGSPTTYAAIKLCEGQKFIIIDENLNRESIEGLPVFDKLSTLKEFDENIYVQLTKEIRCQLPGDEINLLTLIEEKPEILDTMTTDELLKIINQPFMLKQDNEELPGVYINRSLYRNFINPNYLQEDSEEVVILVGNVTKEDEKHECFGSYKLILVEKYLKQQERPSDANDSIQKRVLYISRKVNLHEEFRELCIKFQNKKECHCFKFVEGKLEWIRSNRGGSKFIQACTEMGCLDEDNFFAENSHNNINVIVGDPGMGKTILLKKLKNRFCPHYLTIIFTPKDISNLVEANYQFSNNSEKCIVDFMFPDTSNFEKTILRYLIQKGEVVYLWDALDEISDQERLSIINIISKFSDKSKMQIVTTRRHLKNFLEEKFDVLSRNITPFDDNQQKSYIEKRLKIVFPNKNELESILKKITSNISNYSHKDILGIPLQIYMITELFIKNPQKFIELFTELFSVTDLFQNFIEDKFNIYFDDKQNLGKKDKKHWFRSIKTQRILDYKESAFNALFFDQHLKEQSSKASNFLNEIREQGDYLGLIVDVRKEEMLIPIFVHASYAEYFAALYLVDNCKNIPDLVEIIFDRNYTNVRFFFDMLLAKESPQHVAVLCKNLRKLEEYADDLKKKDLQGRNILHLASSWSEKYPILNVEKNSDNTYSIDDRTKFTVETQNLDSRRLLEYALKKCDPDEKDDLFGYSSMMYAKKSDCLFAVAMIEQKTEEESNYFKDENYIFTCNLLFYGLCFDFPDVFDMVDDVKFICNNNDDSLLHVATRFNNIHCLKKILTKEIYHSKIDLKNKRQETALFIAAKNGFTNIVQLLQQHGANIEASDEFNQTALLWAASCGHEDTVKLLIKLGANTNAKSSEDYTPLYAASFEGYSRIVKVLIENDADVNAVNYSERTTPLHVACLKGHLDVVRILVESNANINAATDFLVRIDFYKLLTHFFTKNSHLNVDILNSIQTIVGMMEEMKNRNEQMQRFVEMFNLILSSLLAVITEIGTNVILVQDEDVVQFGEAVKQFHSNLLKSLITNNAQNDEIELYKTTEKYFSNLILIVSKIVQNKKFKENHETLFSETLGKWLSHFFLFTMKKGKINTETVKNHLLPQIGKHVRHLGSNIRKIFVTNLMHVDITTLHNYYTENGISKIHDLVKMFLNAYNTFSEFNPNIKNYEIKGETPLFVACREGHSDVAKFLLDNNASINAAANYGATPFYIACQEGHLDILKILLRHNVNIKSARYDRGTHVVKTFQNIILHTVEDLNEIENNATYPAVLRLFIWAFSTRIKKYLLNILEKLESILEAKDTTIKNGVTPLHVASFNGHLDIIRSLIENQADINAVTVEGKTPLFMACQNGKLSVVELLIEFNVNINTAKNDGSTPIYIASAQGHSNVVKLLLERNADIDAAAINGNKPIHIASINGHLDVVKILFESSANINKANKEGLTPLFLASFHGHVNVVKILIQNGVNLNNAMDNGSTPLLAASLQGHLDVVKVLLDNEANIHAMNIRGETSLLAASSKGHQAVVEILLRYGANINSTHVNNVTPLLAASCNGHLDVVKVLLENNANIHAKNKDGQTSLYVASWNGHTNVVEVLIEHGANIDTTDDSTPPLLAPSFKGHLDVVKVLLENNANIHAKNKEGETSLYIASCYGHVDVVELLIGKNADIHAARKDGATPLFVACERGHLDAVKILLKNKANINSPRYDGTTPLSIARQKKHTNIVRILRKNRTVPFYVKMSILTCGWLLSMIFD